MYSAFGVEHGDISKGLKPEHMAALKRHASKPWSTSREWRTTDYADQKVRLRTIDAREGRPNPHSAAYFKTNMARDSRTPRTLRNKNRKPIFGNKENA